MLSKLIPSIVFGGASLLLADVQFEQTMKITGGSMMNMPIVGSKFKEPQVTRHIYQGKRMAILSKENVTVYDLDKETVTTIYPDKREYSVISFGEMRDATEKMMQKMQKVGDLEMTWNVKVDDSGESKEINGLDAKKYIFIVDSSGTDKKSGKTFGHRMEMESWITKKSPGSEEMNAFNRRAAEKLGFGRVGGMSAMAQAQLGKAWQDAAKEFAKMEGFSVLSTTRMFATFDGKPLMVPEGQAGSPHVPNAGDAAKDAAKEAAKDAATSAALGRMGRAGALGGMAGGLGGLRRKKPAAEETPAAAPAASDGKMVPSASMEMTMEAGSISQVVANAGDMQVPLGFKQIEAEILKLAK